MAGTNVQYIIDLMVSDKQLRTQMSKLDWEEILGSRGKDFSKALASGAKEAEREIKTTLGGLDLSSILGEKEFLRLERVVSKVITANAEKIKSIGRDGDTSGIQNIIDFVFFKLDFSFASDSGRDVFEKLFCKFVKMVFNIFKGKV